VHRVAQSPKPLDVAADRPYPDLEALGELRADQSLRAWSNDSRLSRRAEVSSMTT
jgi:hypothetical protein